MITKINTIRHSLAHILAMAIQELYPGVKFGIGPAIENGFYYDFDFPKSVSLSPADLPKIEKKIKEIIKKEVKFEKKIISIAETKKLFKNQAYKLELIKDLEKITIYQCGSFIDLCKGPHIKSTKEINPDGFKLTRIAGAYWKGDEKNKMLSRVYGIAFETKKQLAEYINQQEEAEKRDHRVLGKKLDLFLFDEEIGVGLPIWLPNGTTLRKIIEDYLYKELTKQGYGWLATPHIGSLNLWKTSGHWNFYKENLYSPIDIDNEKYLLKPMNCPFHVKAYQSKIRSYRDLPIKYAELGTVYRYERSGTLHGLTRVRGFTQDDAHIICEPNSLSEEVAKLVKYGLEMLKNFGFKDYNIYLSTRPEKYVGTLENWKKATFALENVLKKLKIKYEVDSGGGVFYGPKIDIKIKDSLGREWQCTTIQFDFNLPERFRMSYIDEKGKQTEPFMIHRALLGSMERFIGVLIEHYAGAFPLWLSPVQIYVLPIADKQNKYAGQVAEKFIENGFRCELKDENETIGKKIREGETQKIPYLVIIGDKEQKSKTINIRARGNQNLGEMKIDKFIERINKEVDTRS